MGSASGIEGRCGRGDEREEAADRSIDAHPGQFALKPRLGLRRVGLPHLLDQIIILEGKAFSLPGAAFARARRLGPVADERENVLPAAIFAEFQIRGGRRRIFVAGQIEGGGAKGEIDRGGDDECDNPDKSYAPMLPERSGQPSEDLHSGTLENRIAPPIGFPDA